MTDNEACQVPLVELLKEFPADYHWWEETHFAEDGTCIGHRHWPVGRYMHEAAAALESLMRERDGEPTDAMLRAGMETAGWWCEPVEAEYECGVPVNCPMSQADCDSINAEQQGAMRDIYKAMIAAAPPHAQAATAASVGPAAAAVSVGASWIPVSERLPTTTDWYAILKVNGPWEPTTLRWEGGWEWGNGDPVLCDYVTHWMPLPALPSASASSVPNAGESTGENDER